MLETIVVVRTEQPPSTLECVAGQCRLPSDALLQKDTHEVSPQETTNSNSVTA
jgi:hypothetical protein